MCGLPVTSQAVPTAADCTATSIAIGGAVRLMDGLNHWCPCRLISARWGGKDDKKVQICRDLSVCDVSASDPLFHIVPNMNDSHRDYTLFKPGSVLDLVSFSFSFLSSFFVVFITRLVSSVRHDNFQAALIRQLWSTSPIKGACVAQRRFNAGYDDDNHLLSRRGTSLRNKLC